MLSLDSIITERQFLYPFIFHEGIYIVNASLSYNLFNIVKHFPIEYQNLYYPAC